MLLKHVYSVIGSLMSKFTNNNYATVCRKPKSAHKTHYKPNSSKAKHSYKVNELYENESENYFRYDN